MITREALTREELRLIGCSDYPPILGMKEPGPVGIYNRSVHGLSPPADPYWAEMGELGKLLEWPAAVMAARKMGLDESKLEKLPTITHPGAREWQRVSFDPIVRSPATIFEVKCRASWVMKDQGWGEPGTGDVPADVAAQVQGQLEAIRADRDRWLGTDLPDVEQVIVAVLVNGQKVDLYPVRRNEEIGGLLRERGEKFWRDHLVARRPPYMDHFKGSDFYLHKHYPKRTNTIRPAAEHEIEALREYVKLDAEVSKILKERDTVENEIRELIGSDEGFEGGGLRVKASERKGRARTGEIVEVLAKRFGVSATEIKEMEDHHRGDTYRVINVKGAAAYLRDGGGDE
jgi:predicted phage-related endonuclease